MHRLQESVSLYEKSKVARTMQLTPLIIAIKAMFNGDYMVAFLLTVTTLCGGASVILLASFAIARRVLAPVLTRATVIIGTVAVLEVLRPIGPMLCALLYGKLAFRVCCWVTLGLGMSVMPVWKAWVGFVSLAQLTCVLVYTAPTTEVLLWWTLEMVLSGALEVRAPRVRTTSEVWTANACDKYTAKQQSQSDQDSSPTFILRAIDIVCERGEFAKRHNKEIFRDQVMAVQAEYLARKRGLERTLMVRALHYKLTVEEDRRFLKRRLGKCRACLSHLVAQDCTCVWVLLKSGPKQKSQGRTRQDYPSIGRFATCGASTSSWQRRTSQLGGAGPFCRQRQRDWP